jgi:hypothetical protein
MASVIGVAPSAFALGRYKTVLFSVSALLLALNYWLVVVRPRRCAPGELCHIDTPFMRFNRRLLRISAAILVLAFVVTYGSEFLVEWR